MKNLMIVGPTCGEIAARVSAGSAWHVRYPVAAHDQLIDALRSEPDNSVDRLDIVDHGGPGYQLLGAEVLFASDDDPGSPLENAWLIAELRGKLVETAQVRLLGCSTAGERSHEGRLLLVKLALLLNAEPARPARIAYGTITGVEIDDFGPDGLSAAAGRTMLFSSDAALDSLPPGYEERVRRCSAGSAFAALEQDAPVGAGLGGPARDE
jgi:hypothetical protein